MSSIPELVWKALAAFQSLENVVGAREPATAKDVRLHWSRFKVWAGSVGAHRRHGHRSLEYRLSGALMIRNHVVNLLKDMCQHLEEGKSESVFPQGIGLQCSDISTADAVIRSEGQEPADRPQRDDGFLSDFFEDDDPQLDAFQQILLQIKNVVDCLMRLAVTVRNPAPHEQFKSRMPALVSSFDAHHLEHVKHKFPRINSKTTEERLAKALTHRRVFFKYREEHHERLKEGIDDAKEGDQAGSRGGVTTEASWLPEDKHHDSGSRRPVFRDDLSEMTATSYAPSFMDGTELRVPRVPSEYVDGPFICPYCYLPVVVENRHQWK